MSLVIPAYNEENYLAACLRAIAGQTQAPYEVIVVDNNSTDNTAAIARSFPFVRLISAQRQGVVYARDAGFDAARGDIIARIDADSIVAPDWLEKMQAVFRDGDIDGVSGAVTYRDVGLVRVFNAIDLGVRRYLARHMGALGESFLYGVNMAIRRDAWLAVRSQVCRERRLHEDQDLAVHLSDSGHQVRFVPALRVSISPRQAAAGPRQFFHYVWSNARVYKEHHKRSVRYIRHVAVFISCLYPIIKLMYRGYDPALGRFSLAYALSNTPPVRISPVSETL